MITIAAGLFVAALISHWNDQRPHNASSQFAEEQLYLNGPTMKRLTLSFNGIAADWYWMRSLQYVGGKIVNYEDTHAGKFDLNDLSSLDLRLLPSLLRMATTLDPQFLEPYYYGALVLPDIDGNEAIALLERGIAANPNQWRLYQHLGYIYWQIDVAPLGQAAVAAPEPDRLMAAGEATPHDCPDHGVQTGAVAAGGEHAHFQVRCNIASDMGGAPRAAREMYLHINEVSDDITIRHMVEKQLMRLDSLDEREKIRRALSDYSARAGHCPLTWKEIGPALRAAGLRVDASGAPLDPSAMPYHLSKGGCDVELDEYSQVPHR